MIFWPDGFVLGVDAEDAECRRAHQVDLVFRAEVVAATMRQGVRMEVATARFEDRCHYLCEEHGANWRGCACFM